MLHPEYPIETARLALRPFRPDDLEQLHAFQSRADVARYLFREARDRDQVAEVLDLKTGEHRIEQEGDGLALAVVARDGGRLLGEVNLRWLSREHRQGEIGFVFNPEFHGRGFAREAAEAVLELGFTELGLHRITGGCDVRNHPSARLMERLGMRREAHFVGNWIVKGEWAQELVYAVLDHEWKARQHGSETGFTAEPSTAPEVDQ